MRGHRPTTYIMSCPQDEPAQPPGPSGNRNTRWAFGKMNESTRGRTFLSWRRTPKSYSNLCGAVGMSHIPVSLRSSCRSFAMPVSCSSAMGGEGDRFFLPPVLPRNTKSSRANRHTNKGVTSSSSSSAAPLCQKLSTKLATRPRLPRHHSSRTVGPQRTTIVPVPCGSARIVRNVYFIQYSVYSLFFPLIIIR